MRIVIWVLFTFTSVVALSQTKNSFSSGDLSALSNLPVRWEHYWNTHDMDGMGTLLSNDIDFVNVSGVWAKGKKETVLQHKQKHLGMFSKSVWTTDSVSVKYLMSNLAVIHIGWGISGDYNPEDHTPSKPRHGLFTWLVKKNEGRWLVIQVANVNIRVYKPT